MPESAFNIKVTPLLTLACVSTYIHVYQPAHLPCGWTHAAAGANIRHMGNGLAETNCKEIDSCLTPPRSDSAFMVMVVITAVIIIIVGIIFSYSDELSASNANTES